MPTEDRRFTDEELKKRWQETADRYTQPPTRSLSEEILWQVRDTAECEPPNQPNQVGLSRDVSVLGTLATHTTALRWRIADIEARLNGIYEALFGVVPDLPPDCERDLGNIAPEGPTGQLGELKMALSLLEETVDVLDDTTFAFHTAGLVR